MVDFESELNFILDTHRLTVDRPLNRELSPSALSEKINLSLADKASTKEEIREFLKSYIHYSVNTQHPFYLNQLWSQTEEASLIGEFVASLTNTSMYTFEVAPVATLLEHEMREVLSRQVWGKPADGIMTSGGTASNLQALMTARNTLFPQCKDEGLAALDKKLTVFAASNSHYSIKRAVNILGMGQSQLIEVPVDEQGRMLSKDLQIAIDESLHRNEQPFCVVSTAGTTVSGSYDDIESIAAVCRSHNLWLHVDGAYGGSALFSSTHKTLLAGVEQADSFSWDFHKILGVHLPCAFLLAREPNLLKKSLTSGNDSYLFHDEDSIDLGPSSLQCGRRNDILKLWLNFMNVGMRGIEKRVDTLFNIAQSLAEKIKKDDDFELVMEPQSINVCFRLTSESRIGSIRDKLRRTGQLMINYSQDHKGEFFRFASTNPSLSGEDLDKILELIRIESRNLSSED